MVHFLANLTVFYVPGIEIPSSAIGYIPLYDKPLGVLYLSTKPKLPLRTKDIFIEWELPSGEPAYSELKTIHEFPIYGNIDFSNYLVFNPELLKIAHIAVVGHEIILRTKRYNRETRKYVIENTFLSKEISHEFENLYYLGTGVRFEVKVTPKDGSPSSTIYKTFKIEHDNTYQYLEERRLVSY
ncbi:MAG: hypothetical protein ACRCUJ_06190 [Phocaeicola sp.]